jgi:hypothetical protein
MKTSTRTGSHHEEPQRQIGAAAGGHSWWKAWVLLASLGATALGWVAFATDGAAVESAVAVRETAPVPTRFSPARDVNGRVQPRPLPPSPGMVPVMPRKPVFQAPVTRTRRS